MKFFGSALVRAPSLHIEKHEAAFRHVLCRHESLDRGSNRGRRRAGYRVSIRARRDRRKCQGSETVLVGKANRFAVTACQRLSFPTFAPAIDWTDCVNYVLCG